MSCCFNSPVPPSSSSLPPINLWRRFASPQWRGKKTLDWSRILHDPSVKVNFNIHTTCFLNLTSATCHVHFKQLSGFCIFPNLQPFVFWNANTFNVNALMPLIHHVKLKKFYMCKVLHGMQLNICITKKTFSIKKKKFKVILCLGYWKVHHVKYFLESSQIRGELTVGVEKPGRLITTRQFKFKLGKNP